MSSYSNEPTEYKEFMFGIKHDINNESDKQRVQAALNRAHDIRKFEIDHYWRRALYFWGFEIALLVAAGQLLSSDDSWGDKYQSLGLPLIALSVMGIFISIAWFYICKGSKAWQENWEHHVDFLETPFEGNLYKVVLGDRKNFYSVTNINMSVVRAWGVLWVCAFLFFVAQFMRNYIIWEGLCAKYLAAISIGIVALLIVLFVVFHACVKRIIKGWRTKFNPKPNPKIHKRKKKFY